MSAAINIADITGYTKPGCSCNDGVRIDQALRTIDGVLTVHFDADLHPHAMIVAYNSKAISSDVLLEAIRGCDPGAVKIGL